MCLGSPARSADGLAASANLNSKDETHCIIEWDGSEGNAHYAVKVTDCSKRGTYVSAQLGLSPQRPQPQPIICSFSKINGRAICEGGNKFAVLRDGSEIQLGKSGAVRMSRST